MSGSTGRRVIFGTAALDYNLRIALNTKLPAAGRLLAQRWSNLTCPSHTTSAFSTLPGNFDLLILRLSFLVSSDSCDFTTAKK
jgi:hypothetical protein